jgi:hypothetical protein
VLDVRLVKLVGAWAGADGEAALQQAAYAIKVRGARVHGCCSGWRAHAEAGRLTLTPRCRPSRARQASHRFAVDVGRALLCAGALVTLRRLRGGPGGAAGEPAMQLRLVYPLAVSLLQQDFIIPR